MNFCGKSWLEISKSAIKNNVRALAALTNKRTGFLAVVKANAYGHGLEIAAKEAIRAGADWLGVDNVSEAERARAAVRRAPILILGYTPRSAIRRALNTNARLIVYDPEVVRAIGQTKRLARIHLKIETGTTRHGVGEKGLRLILREARKYKSIVIEGLSTHYANIEDTTDHRYAAAQLTEFVRLANLAQKLWGRPIPIRHTAASAAAILFPETHFNLARFGIALYGLWPSRETMVSAKERKINLKLEPALSWKAILAQVKDVKKGTPVSYGLTARVTRDSKVAVVPVGYSDGYDRGLSSIGEVLIRGRRAPILGRVCMNMFMIDVTDIGGAKAEDEVVLIGRDRTEFVSADELAAKIGTINYEIVSRISAETGRRAVA